MDIELSKEDLKFQAEVEDFLEKHLPKGAEIWSKRAEWFAALKEKGWDVPNWPEEFGGPGWTPTQHFIWDKVTCKYTMPPTIPFGQVMLAPILMKYGSKVQQDRFLPDIRDNKVMWCQGYSEPGAGSDLASLKTKAELTPDGKHYIVNGTKIWTTMGHVANWIFCLTRTQTTSVKQEGITFLLFDMKTPGVEVKPIYTLGGSHHVNQVFFTDVKVPVENRVGEENQGWTYAKGLLQHERKGLAGISRSVFAMEKLKEKVMKVPVGDKTLMETEFKKKIAVAEIDLLALEYTELRTLADMVKNGTTGHASSILKLKGTMMQQTIQELTLEAAGIYGAPWGHQKVGVKFGRSAMEMYLNGRPATIYGGCSEVQRDVIAKRVLSI